MARMILQALLLCLVLTGHSAGALASSAISLSSSSSSGSEAGSSKYDCDRGCPLSTFPVCGRDGEWYQNACMAHCARMEEDASADACGGVPMPFQDAKPGPHGAESGRPGGPVRLIDRGILNAFKEEGLRYVGRIKLARELGPRPFGLASRRAQQEPDNDGEGNWKVATLRCTSDGDVYRGIMYVPMAAMDLKAAEPSRLLSQWFKGGAKKSRSATGGSAASSPEAPSSSSERLLPEAGELDSSSGSSSRGAAPVPGPAAAEAPPQQQQKQWWRKPLAFVWDKVSALLGHGSSGSGTKEGSVLLESGSSSSGSHSSSSSRDEEEAGDNGAFRTPPAITEEVAAGGAHTTLFDYSRPAAAPPVRASGGRGSNTERAREEAEEGAAASARGGAEEDEEEDEEDDAALLADLLASAESGSVAVAAGVASNNATSAAASTSAHRRLLEIINGDDRFLCDKGYPYTALGQIQVVDSTGLYICTGVLIRPNKVLTAAHCVWNTKRGAFYYNLNFAPGRYRAEGKMVNPWGVVPWKSVTVFDAFKRDPSTWDVAVVTLSKSLGSVTGYMGMAAGCSSNTELTVAGYPQDQAQGTCMANTCRVPYLDCNALTNVHTCDTIMGMSGSPLWDSKNRIRMIHVAGIAGRPENRATTVTQFLVNTISKW